MTEDEFVDYYQNVSATIDDDTFFTDLINRSWGLNKTFDVSEGFGGKSLNWETENYNQNDPRSKKDNRIFT